MIRNNRNPSAFALAAFFYICAAPASAQVLSDLEPANTIKRFLATRVAATQGRVEITVEPFGRYVQSQPCEQIEPFLPAGARLWGRVSVGLRCTAGANWTLSHSVYISVFGPAVVANVALRAGERLSADDFRMQAIDLTRHGGELVSDPAELNEQTLTRNIGPGQPIRRDYLRAKPAIASGDPVRIAFVGDGFSVMAEGTAMGNASAGQRLRVRADTGRVLSGTARADRTVEVP
jgi:flagellar basal body P-ring formation protein FlgA